MGATKPHLSSEFEDELAELRSKLLLMACKVEDLIAEVTDALVERDSGGADQVIVRDKEIDRLEKEVDDLCIRILALRQPAASDLRHITTALKVVTDLERMGDLCVNIARATRKINQEPQVKPYVDIPRMALKVRDMVRRSLDSFVQEDPDLAKEVVCDDRSVDELNDRVFAELLTQMCQMPSTIPAATHLILVGRHLERIADHATNVAEQVIFMVMGDDVRHEKAKIRAALRALEARAADASDGDPRPPYPGPASDPI